MTISQQHLQAKRAALTASLEQIIGQANRLNGAIAVVDELIAESVEQEDSFSAIDVANRALDTIEFGGIDRASNPYWNNYFGQAQFDQENALDTAAKPEMLPVIPEDATEGDIL